MPKKINKSSRFAVPSNAFKEVLTTAKSKPNAMYAPIKRKQLCKAKGSISVSDTWQEESDNE